MTPKEINQLVAEKIMGWTPKPCDLEETGREWTVYDDGYCWCPVCKVSEHISDFEHGIIPPPCYSTDMNAAWLVLQKMVEQQYQKAFPFGESEPRFKIFADTLLEDDYFNSEDFEIWPAWKAVTIASTWNPEKICRAALKTIGAL